MKTILVLVSLLLISACGSKNEDTTPPAPSIQNPTAFIAGLAGSSSSLSIGSEKSYYQTRTFKQSSNLFCMYWMDVVERVVNISSDKADIFVSRKYTLYKG
jgi:uncharacterized protein YcfL